jgi:hypothetical protein
MYVQSIGYWMRMRRQQQHGKSKILLLPSRTVKRPKGQLTEKVTETGKHNLFLCLVLRAFSV